MRIFSAALAAAISCSGTLSVAAMHSPVTINETGSSLLYPVISQWAAAYKAIHPDVVVTTASTGSGAGIAGASDGSAIIGASDAPQAPEVLRERGLMNIAVTLSAQTISYNIPELAGSHINLSGSVVSGIYRGAISMWDDPAIAKINPDIAGKLPHAAIVPIRRSDASGDTFLFTSYLSKSDYAWSKGPGAGLEIRWPASSGEVSANGNTGVLDACTSTKYSVCYLGISYVAKALDGGVNYAALANASGAFILPEIATIKAAALANLARTPPDEGVSLVYAADPTAYPIVNYEYAIIKVQQRDPSVADALKTFLRWAISVDGGNNGSNLTPGFTALPPAVATKSLAQIANIK